MIHSGSKYSRCDPSSFPVPGLAKDGSFLAQPHAAQCLGASCPLSPSVFRLSLDVTETELHSLFARTKSLQENIQRDQELARQMEDFLQVSPSPGPAGRPVLGGQGQQVLDHAPPPCSEYKDLSVLSWQRTAMTISESASKKGFCWHGGWPGLSHWALPGS